VKRVIVLLALVSVLPGCAARLRDPVTPVVGPPVTEIPTPYGEALACLGRNVKNTKQFTVGVGAILDKSGKFSLNDGGYKVPQGPDLMAISALAKTRAVRLVERSDTRVIEWELKYANDKVLGDGPRVVQTPQGQTEVRYRGIYPGSLTGSDFYLIGAVTSVDYNVFSGGVEANVWGIGAGYREFRLLISVDLHLVDTRSSTIKEVASLSKQIVGYETQTNVFKFFGSVLVNYDGGTQINEPLSVGVRSVIERAVFDIVSDLYGIKDGECKALAREAELTVAGDSSGAKEAKAEAEHYAAEHATAEKAEDGTDAAADGKAAPEAQPAGASAAPVPPVSSEALAAPAGAPAAADATAPATRALLGIRTAPAAAGAGEASGAAAASPPADNGGAAGATPAASNSGATGASPAADNSGTSGPAPAAEKAAGPNPSHEEAAAPAAAPPAGSLSGAAPAGAAVGESMPPGATSTERPQPRPSAMEPVGRTQAAAVRPDGADQPAGDTAPTQ
jgi:curli biogenesis system outer membrane secretion channel CsgG